MTNQPINPTIKGNTKTEGLMGLEDSREERDIEEWYRVYSIEDSVTNKIIKTASAVFISA
jgi:hypothetical protein